MSINIIDFPLKTSQYKKYKKVRVYYRLVFQILIVKYNWSKDGVKKMP
jgi:hypothetical protein